jgi:hypothetical protein
MDFLDAIKAEIAALTLKLRELDHVRALYENQENNNKIPLPAANQENDASIQRKRKSSSMTELVIEKTKEFLLSKDTPIRTVDILNHLNSIGTIFGGAVPQNTLSAVLSRSELFESHGKSGWVLKYDKKIENEPIALQSSESSPDDMDEQPKLASIKQFGFK